MSPCCSSETQLSNEQRAVLSLAAQRLDQAARTLETIAKVYGRDRDRQEDARFFMDLAAQQANSYVAVRQLLDRSITANGE